MSRTKSFFLALTLAATAPLAAASGGAALPYKFEPDTANLQSVQRGARNFMSYCSGCHSMRHMRYGRIGQDLQIPEEILKTTLMLTTDKVGEPILSSMPAAAANWFGQQPPDLTVETRMRGPDWVYNYLMTFYVDTARPLGVNNLVLPGASMPHVLGDLQGWQVKAPEAAHGEEEAHGGHAKGSGLELAQGGKLTPDEYKKFVGDTVNFMTYAAEPGRAGRISLGIKVMLFLVLFTILAYLLKKEFWKDIH